KIYTLKSASESILIIEINKYLNLIVSKTKLLQDTSKKNAIKECKFQYEKEINKKVKEVYEFIHNQIESKIDSNICDINDNIDLLIDETISLKKSAKKNVESLREKQKKLKKMLVIKQILGVLKIADQTISFVGGSFGVVGEVIKGGVNIAESFA
ncbi:12265_t:CDS:1, partial [Racocetra persica]